jgi:UDP-glucose 4-epimerase
MRKGERFGSALTKMNLNNKIIKLYAKIKLKDYINNFLRNNH